MRVSIGILPLVLLSAAAQDRPWHRISVPDYRQAARNFRNPPAEYAMVLWWFWNGPMTEQDIMRDLAEIHAGGVRSVMIWPYYGTSLEYLSPLWFERVRFAVAEARRLQIRVWLMDEGGYPSGFVGGRVNRDYPELGMQVLAADQPVNVRGGTRVALKVSPATLAVTAANTQTGESIALSLTASEWTAPPGDWAVTSVRREFRTSPTRHVNRPGFPKDTKYTLFDALNPAATRRFLADVHEQYRKYIGAEFGRTVMGFMGDEPSVAGMPWTPALFDRFRNRKGYDLQPELASLFRQTPGDRDARIKADYYDVWTDLYDANFFRPQTEWCERQGLEYVVHLCGEEDLRTLIKLNGDYFKCNRSVQIAGVDAIWRQIWPGVIADYPKLASSSAHLRGRPRAFTESYAVYGTGLSLEQAKWVMDHQFVRGINHFQAMEFLSSPDEFREYFHPPDWRGSPLWAHFPQLAVYANRLSWILSIGRPAAEIAVYYPTTSGWLGDFDADRSALSIARELLETQRDFDFIDEDGLRSLTTVRDGRLWNRSGQGYRTVIVPSVSAISNDALRKIEQFAKSGGNVYFTGRLPRLVPDRTFREAPSAGTLSWARQVSSLYEVRSADVMLTPAARAVKYLHRRLADSELYFFFNEADARLKLEAALAGAGAAEVWDPVSGERARLPSRADGERVRIPILLEPYESKLVVVSRHADARPVAQAPEWSGVMDLDNEWEVEIGGKQHRTPLKTWADLGAAFFQGAAHYRREFTLPAQAAGKRLAIDLGSVRYAARLKVNGQDLGPRAWRPYRWDAKLRVGRNIIEVEVRNTRANELADPARFRELDSKGFFHNSYLNMYWKFDKEMLPSGLLGPVRVLEAN